MVTSFSFVILLDLFPFFLVSVARGLWILLVSSKNQLFVVLIFWIVFLFSMWFNSTLIFILYFFSQTSLEGIPSDSRKSQREGERDRGRCREREKHQRGRHTDLLLPWCALSADCTQDWAIYLDWESNPWPFSVQDNTTPYQPLSKEFSTFYYISSILLTLGSFWFPFCSSLRHYIRLFTQGFSFLIIL